ncbi:MAG: hypothetical protein BM485_13690 [Desulfobulbaceae bacterium DB1]|nr:MAG: hypothetical protein BM485_13690 [Desulfobulbaceae bacterium DB1]
MRGLASKINVSHAYCIDLKENLWEFRIWGWLPINDEVMPDEDMQHFLLACLQQEMCSSAFIDYISGDWGNHEVADREWLSCESEDGLNYLETLLQEKEGASI